MVCSANICRSPMAEGLMKRELMMRGLDHLVEVDSAGTHVFKPGHRPDKRAQQVADKGGINIRKLKARMISEEDFQRFDHILAMDEENLHSLQAICPEEYGDKLSLIMSYAPGSDAAEIPDPYFGNLLGFERVQGLLELGCRGLVEHLITRYGFS